MVFDGAEAGRGVGEGPGDEVGARRLVSTPSRQEEEVGKMFFEAKSTLMFSPIYKDDWQAQVNTNIEEWTEIRKAK